MRRVHRNATDAELDVLKALWELGPTTIRQLTDRLYPDGGPAHYATVQKLLERLEAKSCVSRRQRARINVYRATVDRSELIARRLRETADRLCDGSLTPVLTQLVDSAELTPKELAALRELVKRQGRSERGS
ncbi:MAG: BlaI/MecI/CopY family transcriptional regulator [Acidobacteriota bacterium]|nr:MAG: BlaI/MecI/CopY family transcriptional regulator [Acidobacteriota bacterium]